jgi:hypothetical protein
MARISSRPEAASTAFLATAAYARPAKAIQGFRMRKDFERCYVTAHGSVAVLTMNHPEVMNAASVKMVSGPDRGARPHRAPDSGFARSF